MASALETAQQRLALYLQREASLLAAGQEYSIGGRRRRDVELSEVRTAITDLQNEVARLENTATGASSLITAVPQ